MNQPDRTAGRGIPFSQAPIETVTLIILGSKPGRGLRRLFPGEGTIREQISAMDGAHRLSLLEQLASEKSTLLPHIALGMPLKDIDDALKVIDSEVLRTVKSLWPKPATEV